MTLSPAPTDVDRIVLGCNGLSTLPTRRAAFSLLEAAVDCGIRHFDTARAYGRGYSERVLGEFLAAHGHGLRVTTKSGPARHRFDSLPTRLALPLNSLRRSHAPAAHRTGPLRAPTRRIARDELERSLEASLRCLKRSWIDVFLLHEGLPSQLDDPARDLVATLRRQGVVRSFGIGTARSVIEGHFVGDPLCEVLQYDRPLGAPGILMDRFPGLHHVYHGIFHGLQGGSRAEVVRASLAANPAGRVIFGTRHGDRVRANLSALS